MTIRVRSIAKDRRGQGLVEYALVIALIALVAVIALNFFGTKASNMMTNTANTISNVEG